MGAGHWVSEHALQTDNVKYLLHEIIVLLEDMKSSLSEANVSQVAVKVLQWLTQEFLQRPAFKHLGCFKGVLEGIVEGNFVTSSHCLTSEAWQETVQCVKLIESLAECTIHNDQMPNLTLATVSVRTKFRTFALYLDFVSQKVTEVLQTGACCQGWQ